MHAISTEWVSSSPLDFEESKFSKTNQSSFRVLPSPYAIPVEMRIIFDDDSGTRSLEIKYLGAESTAKGIYRDEAEISYGRKTLRPTFIVLKMNKSATINQFISKVDVALESFLRVHASHDVDNLKLTLSCIRTVLKKFQTQFVPVIDDE